MKKFGFVLFLLAFVSTLNVFAGCAACDGRWILRFRIISVSPDDSSSTIADTGTGVAVDSDVVPEFDVTYMMTEHWGLELIAGTSKHDLSGKDGSLAGADMGSIKVLPPTLTLNYHFTVGEKFHPYVGAGINYTTFYNYDLSGDLASLGVKHISFDSSTGLAGQVGLDIDLKNGWLMNFDVKYIDMSTDAKIILDSGEVLDTVSVDINPWVLGFGFGYRF